MHKIYLLSLAIFVILGCKASDNTGQINTAETARPEQFAAGGEQVSKSVGDEPTAALQPNRSPILKSVDVTPDQPKLGDTIIVTPVIVDPDNDNVTIVYKWQRNGEILPETSDTLFLDKERFRRGDALSVIIIPSDGKAEGNTGMLNIVLPNTPPEIVSSPSEARYEKRKFIYALKAVDKDLDPIRFSLKTAPAGMVIDQRSGVIEWVVPVNVVTGTVVKVGAQDDFGGEAIQSFSFEPRP